jgi:hypothetical protein
MAKIDKVEKFLKEETPKKIKDLEVGFDIESFEKEEDTDTLGFRSEFEPIAKGKEKTLKKEIQVTTPGLKKSIKKFEDFKISISIDKVEPEEDVLDVINPNTCDACQCETCECGETTGDADCCSDCQCEPCECSGEEDVTKFSNFNDIIGSLFSESLKYHLKNNKPITENIFRPGSVAFYDVLKETRNHFDSNRVSLTGLDKDLFESTEIGKFAKFNGEIVPLDLPMETIEEMNEAEYKGREVELNHPMRGGAKKYHVFVKNPKTGKVKKISFGDVHGGLTAKVSDPKARKNFAARHKCDTKKDKTKAGYWACRINRYGHLWNNKTYPGFW